MWHQDAHIFCSPLIYTDIFVRQEYPETEFLYLAFYSVTIAHSSLYSWRYFFKRTFIFTIVAIMDSVASRFISQMMVEHFFSPIRYYYGVGFFFVPPITSPPGVSTEPVPTGSHPTPARVRYQWMHVTSVLFACDRISYGLIWTVFCFFISACKNGQTQMALPNVFERPPVHQCFS